jgi:hypothetical protein
MKIVHNKQALVEGSNFAYFPSQLEGFRSFCGTIYKDELLVKTHAGQTTSFPVNESTVFEYEGGDNVLADFPFHICFMMKKRDLEPNDWLALLEESDHSHDSLFLTIADNIYFFEDTGTWGDEKIYYFEAVCRLGAGENAHIEPFEPNLFLASENALNDQFEVFITEKDLKALLNKRDKKGLSLISVIVDGDGSEQSVQVPVQCLAAEYISTELNNDKPPEAPNISFEDTTKAFNHLGNVSQLRNEINAAIGYRHHDTLNAIKNFVADHARTDKTEPHYQYIQDTLNGEMECSLSDSPLFQTGIGADYILRSFDVLSDEQCFVFTEHAMRFEAGEIESLNQWRKWRILIDVSEKALQSERYTLALRFSVMLSDLDFADGPVLKAYLYANGFVGEPNLNDAYSNQVLATGKLYLPGYGDTLSSCIIGGLFAHAYFTPNFVSGAFCVAGEDGDDFGDNNELEALYKHQINQSVSLLGKQDSNVAKQKHRMFGFDVNGILSQ